MIRNPFASDIEEIINELRTDPEHGLDQTEIANRIKTYGPNALKPIQPKKWWVILAGQFLDPIIYILLIATILAIFFYGSMVEAIAILVVILLTVAIGFFMEVQAVRSLESLSKMEQQETSMLRSRKILRIPASGLVPADARVCYSENLETRETMLTGESTSVQKSSATLPEAIAVSDQKNMVRFVPIYKNQGSPPSSCQLHKAPPLWRLHLFRRYGKRSGRFPQRPLWPLRGQSPLRLLPIIPDL